MRDDRVDDQACRVRFGTAIIAVALLAGCGGSTTPTPLTTTTEPATTTNQLTTTTKPATTTTISRADELAHVRLVLDVITAQGYTIREDFDVSQILDLGYEVCATFEDGQSIEPPTGDERRDTILLAIVGSAVIHLCPQYESQAAEVLEQYGT